MSFSSTSPDASVGPGAASPHQPGHGTVRDRLMLLAIVIVALMFLAMVATIYVKSWLAGPPASALVVVRGAEAYNGTAVTLEQAGKVLRTEYLSADNSYVARFALPAGRYSIYLSQEGVEMGRYENIRVADYQYFMIQLGKRPEATGPPRSSP